MPKFSRIAVLALVPVIALALARPSVAAAGRKHGTPSVRGRTKKQAAVKKPTGPRQIEDARAVQIQLALIRAGYLSGEPSGHWDAASQSAMVKFQGDNGWQTKLVPDSRALIKLGLGPDNNSTATATASTALPTASNP